jgi:hypothetical protein
MLHPGVVIGADGFGFAPNDAWEKIEQLGAVQIGNDVEIGANTCIDRGALQDTVIEDGVKLDNLIQIGHNVRVGRHTAMAGCAGVAGSATIGEHCTVGGGAIMLGHLTWPRMSNFCRHHGGKSILKPGHYTGIFPIDDNALGAQRRTLKQLAQPARPHQNFGKKQTNDGYPRNSQTIAAPLPILMVDRVLEIEKGKSIKALKNVTINEPFFGPFSAPPGDARCADAGSHGTGRRLAVV